MTIDKLVDKGQGQSSRCGLNINTVDVPGGKRLHAGCQRRALGLPCPLGARLDDLNARYASEPPKDSGIAAVEARTDKPLLFAACNQLRSRSN